MEVKMETNNVINVQMDKDYYNSLMEGGGSSGGGVDPNDENYVEYLDVKQNVLILEAYPFSLMQLKIKLPKQISGIGEVDDIVIVPFSFLETFDVQLGSILDMEHLHIKLYPNIKSFVGNRWTSAKEMLINYGMDWNTLPRITKEEFYKID